MSVWGFWAAYAAGYLFTYRRTYLALMSDDLLKDADKFDRGGLSAVAMLMCIFWPLVIVGYGIWRIATPVTPGERKAELDARERYIENMERELNIKRD